MKTIKQMIFDATQEEYYSEAVARRIGYSAYSDYPDFMADNAAITEAVAESPAAIRAAYCAWLIHVCEKSDAEAGHLVAAFWLSHATASQRCLAFVLAHRHGLVLGEGRTI